MRGRREGLAGPRVSARRLLVGSLAAVCLAGAVPARSATATSSGVTLVSAPNDDVSTVSIAEHGVRAAWATWDGRAYLDNVSLDRTYAVTGPGGSTAGITEPQACTEGGPYPDGAGNVAFAHSGRVWIGYPGTPPTVLPFDVPGLVPGASARDLAASPGCRFGVVYTRWVSDGNGFRDEVFVARSALPDERHTQRISVDRSGGTPNGDSWQPSISDDARHVAFVSDATDLVVADTNGAMDVFVRDLSARTIRLVSVDRFDGPANGWSWQPSVSGDGRYVAFASAASDLVAGDTNGHTDVFLRDLRTGTTRLVSVDRSGGIADGESSAPSISADGRHVAFESFATDLVAADPGSEGNIFVRDLRSGRTRLVTVDRTGGPPNEWSHTPEISADGRWIAFLSYATDLVPGSLTAGLQRAYTSPNGPGYRLTLANGDVFAFGTAHFHGDANFLGDDFPWPPPTPLNRPIVGAADTPSGRGYWLVATDGGIFTFGDARFLGSLGGMPGLASTVTITSTPW